MSTAERKAIKDAVDEIKTIPDTEASRVMLRQFLCDVNRIADCLEVIAERMPNDMSQPKVI